MPELAATWVSVLVSLLTDREAAELGRASTLPAAILVLEGIRPADAWDRIAIARGLQVPDTPAQRAFIVNLTVGADDRDRPAQDA